jgi:hypothetical protein
MMAHGDAREEKWRGNKRMEWVTSKRHMTAEHRLAREVQTLQADVHSSPSSSRLNWRPLRFKWTRPFRRKAKSGFCACAITFQTQSTTLYIQQLVYVMRLCWLAVGRIGMRLVFVVLMLEYWYNNKCRRKQLSIYFNNQPPHISSRFTAHHEELLLFIHSSWYVSCWAVPLDDEQ